MLEAMGSPDHLHELLVAALDQQRGEHARRKRAGIDIDAVLSHLRIARRRVAVHDDLGEKPVVIEERIADPDQVARLLLVEWNAGPDAGMAEEEITELDCKEEIVDEAAMLVRDVA